MNPHMVESKADLSDDANMPIESVPLHIVNERADVGSGRIRRFIKAGRALSAIAVAMAANIVLIILKKCLSQNVVNY